MTDQVPAQVTELPVKPSTLKKWSKRTAITAIAVTAAAFVYLKVSGSDDETTPEQTPTA